MIDGWPLAHDEIVRWGDLDALNHVNNVVWLRWLEDARGLLFSRVGIPGFGDALPRHPYEGPVLARIEVDYRRPVLFPDTVRVLTGVSRIGRTSFTCGHALWSSAAGVIVGEARAVVVMVDYRTGAPIVLDGARRAALTSLSATD